MSDVFHWQARLGYLRAAEAGYEVAESNAAWLLERGAASARRQAAQRGNEEQSGNMDTVTGECGSTLSVAKCEALALRLYQHAAKQGNAEASLKVGDFFYAGKGGLGTDYAKAAHHYQSASDARLAQATFNLGFMYQRGIGVRRDMHLAKCGPLATSPAAGSGFAPPPSTITHFHIILHQPSRRRHYDLAAESSSDALWPTQLALGASFAILSKRLSSLSP